MNNSGQPTVVVGIDGSAPSRAALRWAVGYTRPTGTRVTAVAVWQAQLQFGPVPVFPGPEFEREAREWLDQALAELADTPDVVAEVGQGDPARVLIELARDAELLVLGNCGRGAVAAALLGSVAQRCAQHARCPVVLVPASGD
ncbi:universal stress protein [Amycolatopsis anabasis]|uniref:universal stress protein n=1 Tax=Amycolatopsis anabasis TaxID=1840409 RepID=UPI00131E27FF|nr:universal stress protein [Amycolatopsis anabasis]